MKSLFSQGLLATCLFVAASGTPAAMAGETVQPAGIKAVVEEPTAKNGASPIVECSTDQDMWREVGRLCHAKPTERHLASCEDVAKNNGMAAKDMATFCQQ